MDVLKPATTKDGGFDDIAATVVCRQFGYRLVMASAHGVSEGQLHSEAVDFELRKMASLILNTNGCSAMSVILPGEA